MSQTENTAVSYNLINDVSNLYHRAFGTLSYKVPNFDLDKKEFQHMLVRRFVIDFVSLANLFNVSNMYFCFDDDSFRKNIDPQYKDKRSPKPEAFVKTLQQIYDLLKFKGFNVIKVKGLEADDCIALVSETLNHLPKVIISADEDVRQNVKENLYVLVPHVKTRKIYRCLYSIHPPLKGVVDNEIIYPQYVLAEKLCRGCDGDSVPRLTPKGLQTKKINEIADHYMIRKSNYHEDELTSWFNALNECGFAFTKEQVHKQLQLVCLQSEFMPEESLEEFISTSFTQLRVTDFSVESILRNTAYWTDNYNENKKPS